MEFVGKSDICFILMPNSYKVLIYEKDPISFVFWLLVLEMRMLLRIQYNTCLGIVVVLFFFAFMFDLANFSSLQFCKGAIYLFVFWL